MSVAMDAAAPVLSIDAATGIGSVALLCDGAVAAACDVPMRAAAEERLMPAVAAVLSDARVAPGELAAVVCGGGPGSFTSLRIAGAIAKGLAQVAGCPLFALPSLALAAVAGGRRGRSLVVADALRGECYAALVVVAGDGRPAVVSYEYLGVRAADTIAAEARRLGAERVDVVAAAATGGAAAGARAFRLANAAASRLGPSDALAVAPVALAAWEPDYGRKAEAQVRWELAHGRALKVPALPMELGAAERTS